MLRPLVCGWNPDIFKPFGGFQLVKPIQSDGFHNAAVAHDHAGFDIRSVEPLMRNIGRHINEIARPPFIFLGCGVPSPFKFHFALKLNVIVVIITAALNHKGDFFGQMAAGARCATGGNELHVNINTAFLGVHAFVDDMFNQTISGTLHRHLIGFHHIQPLFVFFTEILAGAQGIFVEADLGPGLLGALALDCVNKSLRIHEFSP